MSKQPNLKLEILPCDGASETICPLCGEGLNLSSIAGMLYDDEQPLGCVCEKCLAEHPKEVAGRLRERVADLYDFIEKAHQSLSGEPWFRCIEKVRRRAEHWEALAIRIECLDEWPVREWAYS
jgi:hypothetical protein